MDPRELCYDERFSNAGRVLYSQTTDERSPMKTILTIEPCTIQDPEQLRGQKRERSGPEHQYLLKSKLLCRARDGLFCRSTRVWEAKLIDEKGKLSEHNFAIKENWQDEDTINEAWFYNHTADLDGVAHMAHFDEVDRTRRYRESLQFLGVWVRGERSLNTLTRMTFPIRDQDGKDVSGKLCDRVLVRIVLKEVGQPLSHTVGSRQLIQVAHDITRGKHFVSLSPLIANHNIVSYLHAALWSIYERGILHRDISYGNILLSSENEGKAFIVDFGLALLIDPQNGKLKDPNLPSRHHATVSGRCHASSDVHLHGYIGDATLHGPCRPAR